MDGGSGGGISDSIKGAVAEVTPVVQEAAKDLQDSVGQAIEQGVQSIVGGQMDPQQIQKKEADRQKQIQEVRWQLQQLQKTEAEIEKVRKEKEQKERERLQAQAQEQQVKKMQLDQAKKQSKPQIDAGKIEIKKGVGG